MSEKEISRLYVKDKYLDTSLKYISNSTITEYDMEAAGLNILTEIGWFSIEDRDRLLALDKHDRVVVLGKMLRDKPDMNSDLMKGFVTAREIFFNKNQLEDKDILSIKRDAVFLINKSKNIDNHITDLIHTRKKSEFTEYINIGGKEHYYNIETDKFVVKGYPEEVIESHKDYLFKLIRKVMTLSATNQKEELYLYLANFKDDFLSGSLPIGYYKDIIVGKYIYDLKFDRTLITIEELDDNSNSDGLMINNNVSFITELISTIM